MSALIPAQAGQWKVEHLAMSDTDVAAYLVALRTGAERAQADAQAHVAAQTGRADTYAHLCAGLYEALRLLGMPGDRVTLREVIGWANAQARQAQALDIRNQKRVDELTQQYTTA